MQVIQMPNNRAFIFDVDGTLTLSRTLMDSKFKEFFLKFISEYNTYIVTGSDYSKTLEQLGEDIMHNVKRSYNCSGNSVWEKGIEIQTSEWSLSNEARDWLLKELFASKFPIRTGTHIEDRPGMVNFSIVGRGSTNEERAEYEAYDKAHSERHSLAKRFNDRFTKEENIEAKVAGATGLDIAPKGKDKRQILADFNNVPVCFFGDMMQPGGNDEPLGTAIHNRNEENDEVVWVKDWKHTWSELKEATNG